MSTYQFHYLIFMSNSLISLYLQKQKIKIMKCKYCHKSAGLFSSKHKGCELKHFESLSKIKNTLLSKLSNLELIDYLKVKQELSEALIDGYVTDKDFDDVVFEVMNIVFSGHCKIDHFLFPVFFISIPTELKNKIISLDIYKKYWSSFFESYIKGLSDGERISDKYSRLIKVIKQNDSISETLNKMFISLLEERIYKCLEDGVIDDEEEDEISDFIELSTLSGTTSLYDSASYQKFVQSLVLRDIQEGKTIERIRIDNLPLLLGKKENVLWVFKNVEGYEEKTGHRYTGGSNGVSMRICKGVYYRVGASKGHSVSYQYQNPLGRGVFVVTNKNLYFLGAKQVKLGISKILSFEPYSDGIVLVKDGANPKPYTFVGFDSWFVVNAMQLLVE